MDIANMSNGNILLITVALGLGTVFVGLICLIYITKLMSGVLALSKAKQPVSAAPQDKAVEAAPAPVAIADRGAFSAAIAACIATVMGSKPEGLRIVSIKKVN